MPYYPIALPAGWGGCDDLEHDRPLTLPDPKVPSWWYCRACGHKTVVLPADLTDESTRKLVADAVRILTTNLSSGRIVDPADVAFYAGLVCAVVERLIAPAGSTG